MPFPALFLLSCFSVPPSRPQCPCLLRSLSLAPAGSSEPQVLTNKTSFGAKNSSRAARSSYQMQESYRFDSGPGPICVQLPSKAASCSSMGLKVTPAALTSWREDPCQVAKATPAVYDIRGWRSLVLRGLERFQFLSAKVNGNSTFSCLCSRCPPWLGVEKQRPPGG